MGADPKRRWQFLRTQRAKQGQNDKQGEKISTEIHTALGPS